MSARPEIDFVDGRTYAARSLHDALRWMRQHEPIYQDAKNADVDEAERLRRAEHEASYHSASSLGIDELIDPREIRNVLLHSLERALYRRQAAAEPVARIGIVP